MEVLYLNVNGFAGAKDKRTKGDTNNIEIAKRIMDKIFSLSDPEIIFFSEFNAGCDAGKKVIEYLENEKGYKRVFPSQYSYMSNAYTSIVIAFIKAKEEIKSEKSPPKTLILKWNEIKHNGYRFVGLHIPSELEPYVSEETIKDFYYEVHNHYNHYRTYKDEKVIYIGDMNADCEERINKQELNKLIEAGAIDAWLEKNPNSSNEEGYTTIYKTRIDYAIMTEAAYNNLINIKNLQEFFKEGLSDHSAILINLKDIE